MRYKNYSLILLCISLCTSLSAQEVWSLDKCITYAGQHNIGLRSKQEIVRQQEDELSTARKAFMPTVSASMVNDVRVHGQMIQGIYPDILDKFQAPSTSSFYTMGAEVKMALPIYDGGRRKANIDYRKALLEASELDTRNADINLRVSLAEAYMQVLYYRGEREIAASQTAFYVSLEKRIETMIEHGVGTDKDLKETRSKLALARYKEVQIEGEINNSSMRLAMLMGMSGNETLLLADSSLTAVIEHEQTQSISANEDSRLSYHPLIVSGQAKLKASEASIQMAKSKLMPQVSFETGVSMISQLYFDKESRERMYGFGRQLGEYLSPVFGIRVGIPIYSAGQLEGEIKRARHSYTLQQLQLESDLQQLNATHQKAVNNVNTNWHKYLAAMEAVEASRSSLITQQKSYEAGHSTLFDVNQCAVALMQAEQNKNQSQYEYIISKKILQYLLDY